MHSQTRTGDAIRTLSASSFDKLVLAAPGPVAVEFMSSSCAYCRGFESSPQQVAQRLGTQHRSTVSTSPRNPRWPRSTRCKARPTLLMFRDGAEVGRQAGPPNDVDSLLRAVTLPFEE